MDSAGQGQSWSEIIDRCDVCKNVIDRSEEYLKTTKKNILMSEIRYFHKDCYRKVLLEEKLKFFSVPEITFKQAFKIRVLSFDAHGTEKKHKYENVKKFEIIKGSKMIIDHNPVPSDKFEDSTTYIDLDENSRYLIKLII